MTILGVDQRKTRISESHEKIETSWGGGGRGGELAAMRATSISLIINCTRAFVLTSVYTLTDPSIIPSNFSKHFQQEN